MTKQKLVWLNNFLGIHSGASTKTQPKARGSSGAAAVEGKPLQDQKQQHPAEMGEQEVATFPDSG